jgi:hypothetical protein
MVSVAPPQVRSRGRWLWLFGIGLLILGVAGYVYQLMAMKQITTPWYVPILGTIGVMLMLVGFGMRPTITRGLGVAVVALLCAFQWYALIVLAAVPPYTGPVQASQPIPAFTTALADGRPFTDQDLREGRRSVLVFFRGRW